MGKNIIKYKLDESQITLIKQILKYIEEETKKPGSPYRGSAHKYISYILERGDYSEKEQTVLNSWRKAIIKDKVKVHNNLNTKKNNLKLWSGSKSEYDKIQNPDKNTAYQII